MFLDIIGMNLTDAEYDLESVTRYDIKHFKGESELQQKCWFDYRFMHPMKRSYLFAHYFIENFKSLYREKIDEDDSKIFGTSRPKDPLDNRPAINKTRKLTAPTYLWHARRCADFIGVPYDIYCRVACREAVRIKNNDVAIGYLKGDSSVSKLLLSPSNIYDGHIVEKIIDAWQQDQKHFTRQAVSDFYTQCDFKHQYQRDYEKHLIKFTMLKANPEFALSNLVYAKGLIRENIAAKIFQADDLRRARVIAGF